MSIRVKDILHRGNVKTVRTDTTLDELSQILSSTGFSGAPVVDVQGKLVGVVSQSDVVKLVSTNVSAPPGFYHSPPSDWEGGPKVGQEVAKKTVGEIMERRVHHVTTDDDLSTAARIMRNLHVHRVMVLEHGELVGILSALDLLQVLERPTEFAAFYRESATG